MWNLLVKQVSTIFVVSVSVVFKAGRFMMQSHLNKALFNVIKKLV